MKYLILICIFTLSLLTACQNSQTSSTASAEDKVDETPKDTKTVYYAWVDKLNIREAPGAKGKVVSTVTNSDPLEFTGEQSDFSDEIVLRGLLYNEPWLKVITPDKTIGWAYGGTIKKEGEQKGTSEISDTQFNFEHFGKFNLKNWEKILSLDESGGDAEIVTSSYKKDGQILEITKSEVGEYGYSYNYKLLDSDKKVIKERDFSFEIDPFKVTEHVVDYTMKPMKQYKRSQKVGKHFMQLNSRPLLVNAPWE